MCVSLGRRLLFAVGDLGEGARPHPGGDGVAPDVIAGRIVLEQVGRADRVVVARPLGAVHEGLPSLRYGYPGPPDFNSLQVCAREPQTRPSRNIASSAKEVPPAGFEPALPP